MRWLKFILISADKPMEEGEALLARNWQRVGYAAHSRALVSAHDYQGRQQAQYQRPKARCPL